MMILKRLLLAVTVLGAISTLLQSSDQKPSMLSNKDSIFYKFVNRNIFKKDGKAVIDRRKVALDALAADLKKPTKKTFLGWIHKMWSARLYNSPIIKIESADIDREAQTKAIKMAKEGGYLEPHRDKEGRTLESHREESA